MQSSHAGPGWGPLQPTSSLPFLPAFPQPALWFRPRQLCQHPRLPVSSASICRSCKAPDSPGRQWEEPGRSCHESMWGSWCPAGVGVPRGESAVFLALEGDQPYVEPLTVSSERPVSRRRELKVWPCPAEGLW